jgi:protein-L-isoaspartate(D-aspartate) O-methyltransferase
MFDTARFNMIEAQIRTNDVTDVRIHAALDAVARELFVPEESRAIAYADVPVEIAPGRYLLDPRSFGKALQLVDVRAEERVLDVGSGTGYSAAVLARLAHQVVALEEDPGLARTASERLATVANVEVAHALLAEGLQAGGPYNVIFVNGAIEIEPHALLSQLEEGGRLIAFRQAGPQGRAVLYVKEHGQIGRRDAFDATVPLLPGFKKKVGFVF